jgi:hypothetical protein
MHRSLITLLAAVLAAAGQPAATSWCDAASARIRVASDVQAGARTAWSLLTSGPAPFIEPATVVEVSLERDPAADERVQFEKRIRSRYGNAEAVIKELRAWDDFDILALPGSQVRMLLTTTGADQCESRYFFRSTTSRDVVRIPDPPAKTADESANQICENLGGWGYFARVNMPGDARGQAVSTEAFVEYHTGVVEESVRIVPLTVSGWQPGCTVTAKFTTSATTGQREHLASVTVKSPARQNNRP